MNNSGNGNNNNNTPKTFSAAGQRDIIRQALEFEIATVIAAFEAEYKIPVHVVDIDRIDRDEHGQWVNGLSRYPLREAPHSPLASVRVEFAQGPLVSAKQHEEPEPVEPPETEEEQALREAKEQEQAREAWEESVDEMMTANERLLYGGRYA